VLQTAIEREDYELAAHLRDVIREREEEKDELTHPIPPCEGGDSTK
jgi:protein-arginine kinase activator protein McsA